MIQHSELIINNDGSIFHLHLKPEQISDNIILVGDPGRVDTVASFLDKIDFTSQNREFKTITGWFNGKRITIISTGIGTDNIDIVLNELDALANINLETRTIKEEHKSLNIVRIGTSGGLQTDLQVNSFVVSEKSIGFDGMLNFMPIAKNTATLNLKRHLKLTPTGMNRYPLFMLWIHRKN
jgi:uridine phosphorylase